MKRIRQTAIFHLLTLVFCCWTQLGLGQSATQTPHQGKTFFKNKKDGANWAYDPAKRLFALADSKGRLLTDYLFAAPALFDGNRAIVKKDSLY